MTCSFCGHALTSPADALQHNTSKRCVMLRELTPPYHVQQRLPTETRVKRWKTPDAVQEVLRGHAE